MSAKTNSIQNFVQNSNLHPHFVQLLKGVSFANGQICTDFQVCNKKCSISLHYRTVHLFHWKIRVVLMSTLIMYCATRTFHDTRNILSEMSFFVHPKSQVSSKKISSKIVNFVFLSKMLNLAISFVFHTERIRRVSTTRFSGVFPLTLCAIQIYLLTYILTY